MLGPGLQQVGADGSRADTGNTTPALEERLLKVPRAGAGRPVAGGVGRPPTFQTLQLYKTSAQVLAVNTNPLLEARVC